MNSQKPRRRRPSAAAPGSASTQVIKIIGERDIGAVVERELIPEDVENNCVGALGGPLFRRHHKLPLPPNAPIQRRAERLRITSGDRRVIQVNITRLYA